MAVLLYHRVLEKHLGGQVTLQVNKLLLLDVQKNAGQLTAKMILMT